ncbi:hypothetical protein EZL74_09860 [Flavobacterium silvisoli]|uniref:Uncharacterized protein n=1 Tax=Flavobacterium silvisoli TaxID=2529433 RepID=A0A4V2L4P5_9FLAO|nr:hypothetical protein [Flavobacterium silvisoli]TBX67565.1 hypothetical protein EZL74_09860 [Flavobacterium silvisoli]
MAKNKLNLTAIKYTAAGYFILIATLNLAVTVWNSKANAWQDVLILAMVSLPLLINKKWLYLGYGILLSLISLTILTAYIATYYDTASNNFLAYFVLGCFIHLFTLGCALALVYVGIYDLKKNYNGV